MKGYTRRELNVNDGDLLLILQGTGINADRGGEELMDAIAGAENVILLIVGSGDLIPAMKMKALSLKITDKVRFIPAVPWNEMMRYAKSADAGLSLDKETNENHLFSLSRQTVRLYLGRNPGYCRKPSGSEWHNSENIIAGL